MALIFDARWIGDHGIGRFAREVRKGLGSAQDLSGGPKPSSPLDSAYLMWKLLPAARTSVFLSPGYNAPGTSRLPFVFTLHDLTHIDSPETRSRSKALYYQHFLKPACHRARTILTVSEYSRARIAEWSGLDAKRIVNVGNGVDKHFRPDGERFTRPRGYLFVVGNRRPHKNEARTLAAFAAVAHRFPHDLVFLGEPSPALVEQAKAAQLESRVIFLGRVDDERLAATYRGADAVMFASLHEGFGLPVVEAQASGTPVITSRDTSLPEIAGGAAILVDPRSTEAISDAIERVLESAELRQSLVNSGLVNATRYSWERTAGLVRDVMASIE
jgi:glycosyltransferase involved in cell wall biosynthesis